MKHTGEYGKRTLKVETRPGLGAQGSGIKAANLPLNPKSPFLILHWHNSYWRVIERGRTDKTLEDLFVKSGIFWIGKV